MITRSSIQERMVRLMPVSWEKKDGSPTVTLLAIAADAIYESEVRSTRRIELLEIQVRVLAVGLMCVATSTGMLWWVLS